MSKSNYAIKEIKRHMPENQATDSRIFAKATETSIFLTAGVVLLTSLGETKIGIPLTGALASYNLARAYQASTELADYSAQIDEEPAQKVYQKRKK